MWIGALVFAWIGLFVGALIRPSVVGGRLVDKFGGAQQHLGKSPKALREHVSRYLC